jgi:nucleotide-binding universal stress UspA family protein
MAYKTLFTVATRPEALTVAIPAAAKLCRVHDAHLDILCLGIDRTQVGYSYIGSGAVLLQAAMDRAEEDARALEAAAKAAVTAEFPTLRNGIEAAMTQMGALSNLVAQRARFADLVVVQHPYGKDQGDDCEAAVEAALFEAQSAVLVLPDSGMANPVPQNICIAWNQSREAMAAVRRALPMLKQAAAVSITVIDPPNHGPERSDPGGMLCQMLVRHGVKAEVTVLARSLPSVSDVLLRHVVDMDADLLVMGAYGHSRLREAILGGATRSMLEQTTVPVLMAH